MQSNRIITTVVLVCCALLLTAACSNRSQPTEGPAPTFTPIPTFSFSQPTEAASVATAAAVQESVDPQAVERGLDRYTALECGSCHGEGGAGTDQGPSLVELTLAEEDFITFIRSGGTLGVEHQYPASRLSDSGGRNLYQYLVSLRTSE